MSTRRIMTAAEAYDDCVRFIREAARRAAQRAASAPDDIMRIVEQVTAEQFNILADGLEELKAARTTGEQQDT